MKSKFHYMEVIGKKNIDDIVNSKCLHIIDRVKKSKTKPIVKDYPSVVVGCHNRNCHLLFIETTQSRKNYNQTPILKTALNAIGNIGERNGCCKNVIGACAEPKAAFEVIFNCHCHIKDLKFSKAIRPRTRQIVEYCQNCKRVFRL